MAKLQSPRIKALEAKLEAEGPIALRRFWDETAAQGAPLVESIEGDDQNRLVTFVWQARGDPSAVSVFGGPGGTGGNAMRRLGVTDLWHRSFIAPVDIYCTYAFVEDPPGIPDSPISFDDMRDYAMQVFPSSQMDPLNPQKALVMAGDEDSPTPDVFNSVLRLKVSKGPLLSDVNEKVPKGKLDRQDFRSAILKNDRKIWVYTPYSSNDGGPLPLLLVLGANIFVSRVISMPVILDNLIAEGRVPPCAAVFVGNPGPDRVNAIRESICSEPFTEFIAQELLPWALRNYEFVTVDPSHSTVMGGSFGGLAAMHLALKLPGNFSNVTCASGAFWWGPDGEEPEWLARQIAAASAFPKRCHLSVGRFDTGLPIGRPDILTTNRHVRDVLVAKGAKVQYSEFNGGHMGPPGGEGLAAALSGIMNP